ncbi:GntR family transcriptional regulator [Streptomyces sp. NPDC098781]|uniref:GntR family transcriptional regulator n=1 Tax=Streptomyces sp. NPDC098781 TaxID=3366097 RepID=UPI003815FC19
MSRKRTTSNRTTPAGRGRTPLDGITAPPRKRTAHEYALAALRAAVLDGSLAGGDRLVQTELAERLGVSTTPIREALRDLATEGLVVFDPHRGALVRSLDMDEVRELYELRMALEPLMVRRVIASITAEQLARAEELQRRMEEPCEISDWVELNRAFHAVFGEVDGSSRLATILAGLRDSAAPYVAVSLGSRPRQIEEANAEHAALLSHYRTGAVEDAVALTVAHLNATLMTIEEAHVRGDL